MTLSETLILLGTVIGIPSWIGLLYYGGVLLSARNWRGALICWLCCLSISVLFIIGVLNAQRWGQAL